jgi:hypothetical protein
MGTLTTIGKNTVLDSGLPATLYAALHDDVPGADGSANELTGGTPAYVRQAVTMTAASGGARGIGASVLFDVPAGAVAYASLWTAATGGTCIATDDVTTETFAAQGQYRLNAFTLSISDPA